jgi:hypothetical protein
MRVRQKGPSLFVVRSVFGEFLVSAERSLFGALQNCPRQPASIWESAKGEAFVDKKHLLRPVAGIMG